MKEEILIYDVHKKIQKNVTAFGIEGAFLFFLFGWLIVCFIILMILKNSLGVIFASIVAVIAFLIVAGIANYLSQRMGIIELLQRLAALRQPKEIMCTSMFFFTVKARKDETIV